MTTLNKSAAEVITKFNRGTGVPARPAEQSSAANDRRPTTDDAPPIHALTNVTGFGPIGHLREMLLASENVSATLYASRIPLLEGALECIHAGHISGGLKANREFAECVVSYDDQVSEAMRTLPFDPQTAGGLLIAVPPRTLQHVCRTGIGGCARSRHWRDSLRLEAAHHCPALSMFQICAR